MIEIICPRCKRKHSVLYGKEAKCSCDFVIEIGLCAVYLGSDWRLAYLVPVQDYGKLDPIEPMVWSEAGTGEFLGYASEAEFVVDLNRSVGLNEVINAIVYRAGNGKIRSCYGEDVDLRGPVPALDDIIPAAT